MDLPVMGIQTYEKWCECRLEKKTTSGVGTR